MILCISMPIQLSIGFIVDLRYIPFLVVALYGGYRSVFLLYIILNLYRFYVGGEGTMQSFLFSTTIMVIVPYYSAKFMKLSSRGRILWAMIASFLTIGFYLCTLSFATGALNNHFGVLALNTLTTYVAFMGVLMVLIEKIISNMKNRDRIMHSERLNVVSELAASVSHEIRNPLTVTSGFLQLLSKSKAIEAGGKGICGIVPAGAAARGKNRQRLSFVCQAAIRQHGLFRHERGAGIHEKRHHALRVHPQG